MMGKVPWGSTSKHPHARGEDRCQTGACTRFGETPPRTWGRLFGYVDEDGYDRNTPTHVGKTPGCFPILVDRNTPTHVGKTWL